MITVGIDVGCEWSKVVVLHDGKLLSYCVSANAYGVERIPVIVERGLNKALGKAGIGLADEEYIVATGSHREVVQFAHDTAVESICIARGATLLHPSTRTVIDLGAEKCLVVRCERGRPLESARNDRCAAGSGRYLRMMAKLLSVKVEETEQLSLQSTLDVEIESTCAVFAESEVISLLHQKYAPADIMKGVFRGLARRIYPLLLNVKFQEDVTLIGGLAKNQGIVHAIEDQTGCPILVPQEPSIVGALGAALLAAERKKALARAAK